MMMRTLLGAALAAMIATVSAANESKTEWLSLDAGLERARTLGVPVLVWVAPCPICGSQTFEDPDVTQMLADFVPVRTGIAGARSIGLMQDGPQAAVLDSEGNLLEDLNVVPNAAGYLSPDMIIDAMSSALDVVR